MSGINLSSNVRVAFGNMKVALQLFQPLDRRSATAAAVAGVGACGAVLAVVAYKGSCSRAARLAQSKLADTEAQLRAQKLLAESQRESHVAEVQETIAAHVEHLKRVQGQLAAKEQIAAEFARERDELRAEIAELLARQRAAPGVDPEGLEGALQGARAHAAKMEQMANESMLREAEALERLSELEAMVAGAPTTPKEAELSALLKQTLRREADLQAQLSELQARAPSPPAASDCHSEAGSLADLASERTARFVASGGGGPLQDRSNRLPPASSASRGGQKHRLSGSFTSGASACGSEHGRGAQAMDSYITSRGSDPRAHLQFSWM